MQSTLESVYDTLSCTDIKMAATWRKAICPHLYTQVRSNENKSDWKHHILKGKAEKMKIVPCLFHFRGLEKLGFESDTNPSSLS